MALLPRIFAYGLLALALVGLPAPLAAQTVHTTKVTFLLVNDIYLMGEQRMADGATRGGFARLAAVVKAERAKGGHVVFAHGGDTLSPSLMSGFDRGAHIVALTNLVPPDVFVPGNHEFDFGKATFFQRMGEAKFPIYAANLRGPDGGPLPGIADRTIKTFDGVRVGITGIAYDDTPKTSSSDDLRFGPTVASAQAQAQMLRQEGADLVVAVMHADRAQALELHASRSVDLTLTGHTHDLYIQSDERGTIAESSYDAHYVVAIDVAVTVTERDGRRDTKWWPKFRVIDTAEVAPDPAVAAAVAGYEAEFTREMEVALGTTAVELDSRSATLRSGEAAIGNLFADAMRIAARADAAVMNGGGIRAGRVYAPGATITRKDVLAELPFGNRMVVIEIGGQALREGIENGLAQLPTAGGRFPQVSGMTVAYDPRRPPGRRVTAITVGGEPLVPARKYRVAVNDFLARGGDNYTTFRDAERITPDADAPLVANAVMTHIRALGTVRTTVEGRLTAAR